MFWSRIFFWVFWFPPFVFFPFGIEKLRIGQGFPHWALMPCWPTRVSLMSLVNCILTDISLRSLNPVHLKGLHCGGRSDCAVFCMET